MAKKIVFQLVDDLTGEPIPEDDGQTVQFSFEGTDYEIDLSTTNASDLRSLITRYTDAGRRDTRRSSRQTSAPRKSKLRDGSTEDVTNIRAWAEEQGVKVNKRGRISADVISAYRAAHA